MPKYSVLVDFILTEGYTVETENKEEAEIRGVFLAKKDYPEGEDFNAFAKEID